MTRKIVPSNSKRSDRDVVPIPEMLQTIEITIRKAIQERKNGQVKVMVFILGEDGLPCRTEYQSYLTGNIDGETDQGGNFNFGVAC